MRCANWSSASPASTWPESKQELVYGRLSRRLRTLHIATFREYRELLDSEAGAQEVVEFCNAITTNLTSFFRESHHFDYLRDHLLLPRIANAAAGKRLRIWSAGVLHGRGTLFARDHPVRVDPGLAALGHPDTGHRHRLRRAGARAAAGSTRGERLAGMSPQRRARFFSKAGAGDEFHVSPDIAGLISFKQLNLMHELPMRGRWTRSSAAT